MPRLFLLFALSSLLCTCGPARKTPPLRVSGTVSYNESAGVLEATVSLPEADSLAAAPVLDGQRMAPMQRPGARIYKTRLKTNSAAPLPLTLPCPDGPCTFDLGQTPLSVDSLGDQIFKIANLQLRLPAGPLLDDESLVFFFEPEDRSPPERIRFLGPTETNAVTIRKEGLEGIAPGPYNLYLVKQRLVRDSTAELIRSFQLEYVSRGKRVIVVE